MAQERTKLNGQNPKRTDSFDREFSLDFSRHLLCEEDKSHLTCHSIVEDCGSITIDRIVTVVVVEVVVRPIL